jgi:hypothetical protein
MPKKGHVGTSLGGTEFSPARKKKDDERRKRQDKRWISRSGEVRVSRVDAEPQDEQPKPDEAGD